MDMPERRQSWIKKVVSLPPSPLYLLFLLSVGSALGLVKLHDRLGGSPAGIARGRAAGDMISDELRATALQLVSDGKGVLAADESTGTAGKRLHAINLENTAENRRAMREMLLCAPGLESHLSGVILFEETLDNTRRDGGSLLVKELESKGILLGIKVDKGVVPMSALAELDPRYSGVEEGITTGLEGLLERGKRYYERGCRFSKWRSVYSIQGDEKPSALAIEENARVLAKYASISQEAGLVPIVEPELLMDGAHSIETCSKVLEKILTSVFAAMAEEGVKLDGMLLKTSMVTPGSSANDKASPQQVAELTTAVLMKTVPAAVPGVVFLSGGQSEEEAALNLDAINKQISGDLKSWQLTFSYGRALQKSALSTWNGQDANVEAAREVLLEKCKAASLATRGNLT